MKISKDSNEKEWKDKLKNVYDFAVHEKDKIKRKIESVIKKLDPVELLSHISLVSQCYLRIKSELFFYDLKFKSELLKTN